MNIRLATLAPENSPWTSALRRWAPRGRKRPSKRVQLTVYAGTIPSESSAIARMAVDGLQAATLMAAGLAEIDEAFNVFGIPFFFESDAELAHVQQKLTPMIASACGEEVSPGQLGQRRLDSALLEDPIRTLEDVKQAKLYTTARAARKRCSGTRPTDFMPCRWRRRDSQAVEAAERRHQRGAKPPVYALTLQIFRDAPYMLDIRLAPLDERDRDDRRAWNKISPEDRTKMLEAAAGDGTADRRRRRLRSTPSRSTR